MSTPQHTDAPTKLFIQMSGVPGSGKSTLARQLRPAINGVIIDHDVLRSSLLESGLLQFDQAAKQAYLLQWAIARDVMKQGLSVIIDSTCNYDEVLSEGSALAAQHGYEYWYIECKVQDIDLLDQRLRARNPMASQRTSVDMPPAAARSARVGVDSRALFMKWIDNPARPKDNVITVDSQKNSEDICNQVLRRIIG
ncbi:P-loop containing nucleoside triphosphate hydrolase protein [Xylaria arbuscula]|nr:P-loop containing nucleoside triphosphate hydrolase protein [Xylaria arbuscula]